MNADSGIDEATAVGGRLGDERRIFAFEADFAADLRCIPMVVRFKLDRVGIKLSLKQWSRIGADNRHRLAARCCDMQSEVGEYRRLLLQLLLQKAADQPLTTLPIETSPVWAERGCVPASIIAEADRAGVRQPTQAAWARLAVLERFALVKLSRSNHDNDNFIPALREFGLLI